MSFFKHDKDDDKKIEKELEQLRKDTAYIEERDKKLQKLIEKRNKDKEKKIHEELNPKLKWRERIVIKKIVAQMKKAIELVKTGGDETKNRDKLVEGLLAMSEEMSIELEGETVNEKTLRALTTEELLEMYEDALKMLKQLT